MTNDDPYTQARIDTQRDALAMAVHAARGDRKSGESVALIFKGSEHRELLIHQLARLPYLLVTAATRSLDHEIDFEEEVKEMLRELPRTVEDIDKLIDGEVPFADEDDDE